MIYGIPSSGTNIDKWVVHIPQETEIKAKTLATKIWSAAVRDGKHGSIGQIDVFAKGSDVMIETGNMELAESLNKSFNKLG